MCVWVGGGWVSGDGEKKRVGGEGSGVAPSMAKWLSGSVAKLFCA